ncbi:MAG: hypothetical protein Q9226_006390 [Calogaya cf. arnoldii]
MATSNDNALERLPNELLTIVLGNLPRKRLKQARLVSKRLAALGALRLVDTVYISPREKDMVVFDAITKHPVFSKSIKKIVFDSSQFNNLSTRQYFDRLCGQMSECHPRLVDSNLEVRNLLRLMRGETYGTILADLPIEESTSTFRKCMDDEVFLGGYKLYSGQAREQNNIFGSAWFARALDGFVRIGAIDSVVLGTTFNRMLFCYDRSKMTADSKSGDDEEIDKGTASKIQLALAQIDGRSLTGSPVARTWPPTALIPDHPMYCHSESSPQELQAIGASNGCIEFRNLLSY